MGSMRGRWALGIAAALVVVAGISVASLLPIDVQIRTGANWLVEHYFVYALAAALLSLFWPRPLLVSLALALLAGLLELAQGLTPDRIPDFTTVLAGASGAFCGAILISLARAWRRTATGRIKGAGLTSILGALLIGCALARPTQAEDVKGREFQECHDCPLMVVIPAGTFLMGSPPTETGRFNSEGPQHEVTIKPFAMGRFEVTSEEFLAFLSDTGYQPRPCNALLGMGWQVPEKGKATSPYGADLPHWPAACLEYQDAEKYIEWLNGKVRALHPEDAASPSGPYRLPSEAEWEYAARGGTKTARWWGDAIGAGNANCNGCGSPYDNRLFAEVNSFAPNPFGLYGMLGNAWEWTADCWHPTYGGAPKDGSAWSVKNCADHVIRGGSWHNLPEFVRSAARVSSGSGNEDTDYSALSGFRVARDLP